MATIDKYNTLPEQVLINIDKISDLETETKTLDTGLTDLGKTINENYDSLNERITKNEEDITKNNKSISSIQSTNTSLISSIDTIEGEISQINNDIKVINDTNPSPSIYEIYEQQSVLQAMYPNFNLIERINELQQPFEEIVIDDYQLIGHILGYPKSLSDIILYIHNDNGDSFKLHCTYGQSIIPDSQTHNTKETWTGTITNQYDLPITIVIKKFDIGNGNDINFILRT